MKSIHESVRNHHCGVEMKATVLLILLLLSFNASAVSLQITSSSTFADKSVYITSSSTFADKSVYITSSSTFADKSIYINRGYCMDSSVSVYLTSSSMLADKSVYISSSSMLADLSVYITSSSMLADDEVCVSDSISDEEVVAIYAALNWWIKKQLQTIQLHNSGVSSSQQWIMALSGELLLLGL